MATNGDESLQAASGEVAPAVGAAMAGALPPRIELEALRAREAQRAADELAVVTRLYAVLSRVNEAIVRTRDEATLFTDVCRIAADEGGFPLAWVGLRAGTRVLPAAAWGPAADYVSEITVEVDGPLGVGPTGTAIRERRPVLNDDFDRNPATSPWREATRRHGLRASAAFPLCRGGEVIGALTLYAARPGAFTEAQVRLLEALGADLSYALDAMQQEALRVRADRALRESEERFRALAESMAQLAWTALPDGHITWYNRRWYEYTGTTPAQMEGWGWQAVHHPATLPEVLRRWRASIAAATPFEMEFPLRRADGAFRRFLTRGIPLKDGAGRVVQWVGTNTDVTELVAAREAVAEADRRKTEFLAVLSHELRNPLAPIQNAVVLLRQAPQGSAAADRALEVLDRQAAQLARLVNDLLDISRISHGKIEVELARLDAREVLRRACADARALFERRGVELSLGDEPAPVWVDADAARLAQMVGNLLSNALKFTPPGGQVHVALSARAGGCEIEVRDTGVGLDPGELERIFEPFVQSERTRRGQGGLGLGLALVKELAAKHGGTARAESEGPGRGARVVLQLPLAAPPAAASGRPRPADPAGRLAALIVEDNEDAASTLAELLALDGHRVERAATGAAGLEALGAHPFDVLVCDVGLPDMSGHDLIRTLRASPAGGATFAVALTGFAQAHDRDAALAAGFDAHLPKPTPIPELRALLAEVARRRRVVAAP